VSSPPDAAAAGVVTRNPEEIGRVLEALAARGEPLRALLGAGGLAFTSRLRFVDSGRSYIVLEPSPNESANAALLARPRASFRAMVESMHIEFAASDPERDAHEGAPAIRMRFPDVLTRVQRRASDRVALHPHPPLHLVADAAGVISFDGWMVDVSEGGIGFVQYAPAITLEPGTVLRGCRIRLPGGETVTADLEVRYSCPVALPGGRLALRSGCRFVNLSPEARQAIAAFFGR
jgi:c-di-GMP-binding flagellar brake protein YcgR